MDSYQNINYIYVKNSIGGGNRQRNSSVELFRILATFLVLIVHFNGWLLGGMPEQFTTSGGTEFRIIQMIIESISVVCVNCFIIISGYFGLQLNMKSLWKVFTIVFSVYFPCWIITSIIQQTTSIEEFLDGIFVFSREGYFVQCYLMVLFLSPILNAFVEKFEKRALIYVLCFWGIEVWFEHIRGNVSLGFNHGYSVIHFCLIYLLARMVNLYRLEILKFISPIKAIGIFIICSIIICTEYIIGWERTWDYSNPVVVIESFVLFIPFAHFQFNNQTINSIASGTFTVYLLHTVKPLNPVLRDIDRFVQSNYPYFIFFIFMILAVIATFVICIIYDRIRILLTQRISNAISRKISKYTIL